jgi:hypothetical protein
MMSPADGRNGSKNLKAKEEDQPYILDDESLCPKKVTPPHLQCRTCKQDGRSICWSDEDDSNRWHQSCDDTDVK